MEALFLCEVKNANDYRYFPEPDLQPVIITKEYVAKVKETLPPLT